MNGSGKGLFSRRMLGLSLWNRAVTLLFTGGHISLAVAFKGPKVILGLCKCNYSLTVKRELGTAAGWKQGGGLDLARGPCIGHPC